MDKNKIANPTKFYNHPNDVNNDHTLSTEDKVKLFENWLDDIKLKLIAEEENMVSTVSNPRYYVREINELLARYKKQ
jgi:pyridoxine/pyridoxamine 5'-phosphate oxidase